ncbi:AraC family transcriptional regulator [Methylobacterium oryzae]|uniref:AraC family transcriptional regulator n=1 Tax=Methylobacterium oryzae TaxID=334852 RepID=UPI002F356BA3
MPGPEGIPERGEHGRTDRAPRGRTRNRRNRRSAERPRAAAARAAAPGRRLPVRRRLGRPARAGADAAGLFPPRPGGAPLQVAAGDILLLPRGDAHLFHGAGPPPSTPLPVAVRHAHDLRFKTTVGAEPDVELICGRLAFEAAPQTLIVTALPDLLVLSVGTEPLATRFAPLLAGIREELNDLRAGSVAVAENLASALFMMMLRAHLEASAPAEGLLRLLGQPLTARAVLAMVRDPVHPWTLDELAATAAASRASLVRAFRGATGVAPLEFLTDLRLGLAHHRLRTETVPLDRLAAEVGYQSAPALSRAFLRKYGIRPGQARQAEAPPQAV